MGRRSAHSAGDLQLIAKLPGNHVARTDQRTDRRISLTTGNHVHGYLGIIRDQQANAGIAFGNHVFDRTTAGQYQSPTGHFIQSGRGVGNDSAHQYVRCVQVRTSETQCVFTFDTGGQGDQQVRLLRFDPVDELGHGRALLNIELQAGA
ncbi:hypothetical protein D3C80_1358180 [compost metagenome]